MDTDEFERTVERANVASNRDERIELYAKANELYAGPFLAGWQGDWVEGRRAHYARLQALAQFRFSAILDEIGDSEGALRQVFRAIEADPLREAPRRRALRLLADAGEIGATLEEYDQYRKLLMREVGLAPSAELQTWIADLPSGNRPPKSAPATNSNLPPDRVDRGENEQTRPATSNIFLPPALSSFVGRSAEIAELSDVLLLSRWVTLTGPGGIGKTRLAIETGRANAAHFGAGVYFVEVGDSKNPATLLDTVLRHLQLQGSSDPMASLRQVFSQTMSDGRNACLLIFDGFEHLPSVAIEVLTRLLIELPNATVLVTSRKSLNVVGERAYSVGPLLVPGENDPVETLATNPSVRLFAERAKLVSPEFGLTAANARSVVELCRHVEGVPLSIELAAARSKGAPPSALLNEIADLNNLSDPKSWRKPRHRSIQANLTLSLNALSSTDQGIYFMLCVFRGSFDASAAEAVAQANPPFLERLADHSFLVRDDGEVGRRYRMLDMVRQFGLSHLTPAQLDAAREQHAAYFRRFVADVETMHINSGMQRHPQLRVEAESIRQAADWTLKRGDTETVTRLALGLVWLWVYVGGQQEGLEYVRQIREATVAKGLDSTRLDAAEGLLASMHDDADTARRLLSIAIPALEAAGMVRYATTARGSLAYSEYLAGNYEASAEYGRAAADALLDKSLPRWRAHECHLMGLCLCQLGMLDEAAMWNSESERHFRELGDRAFLGYAYLSQARLDWTRGTLEAARMLYMDALALFDEFHDPRCTAYAIEGLGRVATSAGRYRPAARLLGAAQRIRDSIGLRRDFTDDRDFQAATDLLRTSLEEDFEIEWQAGYKIQPSGAAIWAASLG